MDPRIVYPVGQKLLDALVEERAKRLRKAEA